MAMGSELWGRRRVKRWKEGGTPVITSNFDLSSAIDQEGEIRRSGARLLSEVTRTTTSGAVPWKFMLSIVVPTCRSNGQLKMASIKLHSTEKK